MLRADRLFFVASMTLTLAAAAAHAATADVQAISLLQLRQDARDGSVYTSVPAYTLFNLQARRMRLVRKAEADVVVSAWGRTRGAELPARGYINGDISLAYIDVADDRLNVRVGRQLVFDGVARGAHLDGVHASMRVWGGLGASAFAGVPVIPLLEDHRGRAIAGGRVSWRQSYETQLGFSMLHVLEQGRHAHQHVGVDGRSALMSSLVLAWMVRWSTLAGSNTALVLWPRDADWRKPEQLPQRVALRTVPFNQAVLRAIPALVEADLQLSWQPLQSVHLMAEYRRTAPALFIPRSSIFSVFSAEQRDQFGGAGSLALSSWLTLDADAALLATTTGLGMQGGARGIATFGASRATTLGTQSRVLRLPENGFVMTRIFYSQRLPYGLSSVVDADVYVLERAVHQQRFTTMVSWTNSIFLAAGWNAAVQLAAGSSPLATARVEGLFRIAYQAQGRSQ